MTTFRKRYGGLYTEVKRVVPDKGGEPAVKETVCCCKGAGLARRECADASGNKTPCRCYCHKKGF